MSTNAEIASLFSTVKEPTWPRVLIQRKVRLRGFGSAIRIGNGSLSHFDLHWVADGLGLASAGDRHAVITLRSPLGIK
jgi:hypothetical protein